MNKALKGAVLSGLIFPGLGQVVFKHYKKGALIMLAVLLSFSVIVVKSVKIALSILKRIELEGGVIDMKVISDTVTQVSANSGNLTINFLLSVIFACWVIGTVDAYRVGRKKDLEKCSSKLALNSNNS